MEARGLTGTSDPTSPVNIIMASVQAPGSVTSDRPTRVVPLALEHAGPNTAVVQSLIGRGRRHTGTSPRRQPERANIRSGKATLPLARTSAAIPIELDSARTRRPVSFSSSTRSASAREATRTAVPASLFPPLPVLGLQLEILGVVNACRPRRGWFSGNPIPRPPGSASGLRRSSWTLRCSRNLCHSIADLSYRGAAPCIKT